MKISVVIPTYNRSALLQKTLESLERQSLDRDAFEVVVVDDGSTDDTENVTKKFSERMHLEYVRQWDCGFRAAAARNLGIAAASGELCLFLDTGVLVGSNCLKDHFKAHEDARDDLYLLGVVHGFSQTNENDATLTACLNDDVDSAIRELQKHISCGDIREPVFQLVDDELSRLPAAWCIAFSCLASIKRQRLLAVGMFDPNFTSWGGEDDDLAYRLIKAGVTVSLTRAGCGIHHPHPKNSENNAVSGKQNSLYMFEKYHDPIILDFIEHGWLSVNRYN